MFAFKKLLESIQLSVSSALGQQQRIEIETGKIYDLLLAHQTQLMQSAHINPLNRCGKRVFSQSDEDGITVEILRRLGIQKGMFIEFGVGNGCENNTLVLAALGWRGFWVGGEPLAFEMPETQRVRFFKTWVNAENLLQIVKNGLASFNHPEIDVLSLDFDGNDYYLVETLLEAGHRSKIFIVEYNARFIPPVEFCIDYDPQHSWAGDDYFGASLASFVKLFSRFGYTLVCCNSHTGANAFFVENRFLHLFSDVPQSIEMLYCEPRYFLANRFSHPVSTKTVRKILS